MCCVGMDSGITGNIYCPNPTVPHLRSNLRGPILETGSLYFSKLLQDIQTLDKAAALPIAAATRVTDLRQYINSNLAYSGLKFFVLCTN